jgi:hypothetical protein
MAFANFGPIEAAITNNTASGNPDFVNYWQQQGGLPGQSSTGLNSGLMNVGQPTNSQNTGSQRFTDAQVAAYIRDNNLNPQQIQSAISAFGVNQSQLQRAQQLLSVNDPSIQAATNAYNVSLAQNPAQAAQNLAAYNPATGTGSLVNSQNTTARPQTQNNPSTAPNTNPYGVTTQNPFTSSPNPYIQAAQQTSLGNLAGAQTATAANRVNQQTPYGSLQYTQTGTDAQGNPIWSANQTLSPQLQALTQQSLSGLQNSLSNPAYGINPGQTYSDAIMQRLQPQQQQAQGRLSAQLANQGIMPGSEAYNRAMTLQGQTQNDQLTSAIVGGMQTGLQANTAQNQTAANIKSLASPGYVNPYSQAATTGPDYTGAYATSSAADIAARNAQLAQQNNLTSGLFNIGTAGILGSGGLTGLASAIPGAYNWLTGTAASDYFTNPTSAGTFAGDLFKL